MIMLASLWAMLKAVPVKIQIYAGVALIAVVVLLRWRALGIRAAIQEIERKDRESAQKLREKIAVARSDHPDGDNDIIERLRAYGQLRSDDHEIMHGTQT